MYKWIYPSHRGWAKHAVFQSINNIQVLFQSLLPNGIVAPQLPLTSQFTVTSPLNSHTMLEAGMYQGVQLSTAENITKMIPSVLSWVGDVYHWQWRTMHARAWGPDALKAFSQVASRLAIRGNTSKSKVVAELYI